MRPLDLEHCVTSLFDPILGSGNPDHFGREKNGAKRALDLSRVMVGQARTSDCGLMRLPAEILGLVMDLLSDDKETLARLALVNRDCRQWARSGQFSHVVFDYSPAAHDLLHKLAKKTPGGAKEAEEHEILAIGACIRTVQVKSGAHWVVQRHPDLWEAYSEMLSNAGDPDRLPDLKRRRAELEAPAIVEYLSYRASLLDAISTAMPNLRAVDWSDRFAVDHTFVAAIFDSPIQHLRLDRIIFDEPYRVESRLARSNLRSLTLNVSVTRSFREQEQRRLFENAASQSPDRASQITVKEGRGELKGPQTILTSIFFETLFRLCAPSLEYLDFRDSSAFMYERGSFFDLGSNPINFAALRTIRFPFGGNLSKAAFLSILQAPLREIQMPWASSSEFDEALASCEVLRDLETLTMNTRRKSNTAAFAGFLGRHVHLRKLAVVDHSESVLSTYAIDEQIIPILSTGRFTNLTSLSLHWACPGRMEPNQSHDVVVNESSLQVVGQIQSLEQLRLTAGIGIGWRYQWKIDHDVLRLCLKNLTKLERLALCRDGYILDRRYQVEVEDYYQLLINDWWEVKHCDRMTDEAAKYAAVLPNLEWIYLGQRMLSISRTRASDAACTGAVVVPMTEKRDSCDTYLERMFTLERD